MASGCREVLIPLHTHKCSSFKILIHLLIGKDKHHYDIIKTYKLNDLEYWSYIYILRWLLNTTKYLPLCSGTQRQSETVTHKHILSLILQQQQFQVNYHYWEKKNTIKTYNMTFKHHEVSSILLRNTAPIRNSKKSVIGAATVAVRSLLSLMQNKSKHN